MLLPFNLEDTLNLWKLCVCVCDDWQPHVSQQDSKVGSTPNI